MRAITRMKERKHPFDVLVRESGLSTAAMTAMLTVLEMKSLVCQYEKNVYGIR